MKRPLERLRQAAAFAALILASTAPAARAVCPPFPCPDCWIQSAGQLNLVVMDRAAGTVKIVPNLRVQGVSEDFALVVPTPSFPDLEEVNGGIWDDLRTLTAPVDGTRRQDRSPFGCSEEEISSAVPAEAGDVVVHATETLGGMEAVILTSDDAGALVEWLRDNDFEIEPEDADLFAPYIKRMWFFTAMKPVSGDPRNRMPQGGWDSNVRPVSFTYEADEFELPLALLSINMADVFPIVVYVVDDHRMTLEKFQTTYANKVNAGEHRAISEAYGSLIPFLAPGRFVTKLEATFFAGVPLTGSALLARAADDSEFRRTWGWGGIPLESLVWGFALLPALRGRWRSLRRRRGHVR